VKKIDSSYNNHYSKFSSHQISSFEGAMQFFQSTFVLLLIANLIVFFPFSSAKSFDQLDKIETSSENDLNQMIATTGTLKLKRQVKVGSPINGQVRALYIGENDIVGEGQCLVEIDSGIGDTEVREAQGAYEKALAELEYQEASFTRKKQLFKEYFLPDADLQEAKRNYQTALADLKILKATYEKKSLIFENQKICAPVSGIILSIDIAKGEKVFSEGGALLSIAPDIHTMEVELRIQEKDIRHIQKGQKVQMVVEAYPNQVFESMIHQVSWLVKTEENKPCTYRAKAYIDNPHLLLRPGMRVHATIDTTAAHSVLD
jgi:HlyD family secretion protein